MRRHICIILSVILAVPIALNVSCVGEMKTNGGKTTSITGPPNPSICCKVCEKEFLAKKNEQPFIPSSECLESKKWISRLECEKYGRDTLSFPLQKCRGYTKESLLFLFGIGG